MDPEGAVLGSDDGLALVVGTSLGIELGTED